MSLELFAWHSVGSVGEIVAEKGDPILAPHVGIPSDDKSFTWPHLSADRQRKTVFVRDLGDSNLVIGEPIPVSLEFSDEQVTACCYDLEQFGVGENEFSALDDLRATIVELYSALKNEPRLGPLPQRQLAFLKRVLRTA